MHLEWRTDFDRTNESMLEAVISLKISDYFKINKVVFGEKKIISRLMTNYMGYSSLILYYIYITDFSSSSFSSS